METGQGAGGANGQGDGQQQGGNGEGTGTVPGLEAMAQQMQEFGQQLEPMREFLQSQQWQEIQQAQADPQQPQPQDDPFSGLDLGFLEDPSVAAQMDPEQFSQQLSQTISQAAEQIADRQVEQRVGPVEQQLAEMQRQQDVASLVGEFPEIAEEDTAKQVLQAAGQLAEQMGQPELGQNPKFWRVVYMAGRAADAAAEEQGDISAPAGLESGAGATPGGGGGDLGDQIVGARAGRGVLPF
jgi:hypothetical protein